MSRGILCQLIIQITTINTTA